MPSLEIKKIADTIEKRINDFCLKKNIHKFVIYTNGMGGKLVRAYLDSIDAYVEYTIDNKTNNGVDILSIEESKKKKNDDLCFLICSWNEDIYDEIRKPLYEAFPKAQIIDLFPRPEGKDKDIISEEEIDNILDSLDDYFGKGVSLKDYSYKKIFERKITDLRSEIIYFTEAKRGNYSIYRRKAYALAAFFRKKEINTDDSDILAGNLNRHNCMDMGPNPIEELITNGDYNEVNNAYEIGLFTRSPGGHLIPGYQELIQDGIQGKINKIVDCYRKTDNEIKRDFYESELILIYEFQNKILRYANDAKNNNKLQMNKTLHNIAYRKPEHFIEAVQLLVMAHEAVLDEAGSGSISFGRVDQYLYPFYLKDIKEGIITRNEAQEIINEFWKKIANYEMGWQNITLGGGDIDGNDMSNELTVLCLNAAITNSGDQPQVSLRIPISGLQQRVWDKAFELIQTGKGFPEIYNDSLAIKAKEYTGVILKDACDYGIVGCVEISTCGKEYSHTEAARINLMKLLELMLNDGQCTLSGVEWTLKNKHELDDFTSYEEFAEWVRQEYEYFIEYICDFTDVYSREYAKYWPVPFTSLLMEGCIENAKDVTDCGSIYNNLTLDCVGVASVANALEAIDNIIFKEKAMKLSTLSSILKKNFENEEETLNKLNGYPKYGNDIDSVDDKMKFVVNVVTNTLDKKNIQYRNGRWQAGFYTSYFHATMGTLTGASADGRKAREALSSSLSPMAGTDTSGVLAIINSANKIDMSKFGNGMVLDLKFLPAFWEKRENRNAIQHLIETYFERGGMEIQFNVVDKETLIAAKKNPIKYKNLIVRVSGFSAYFVALEDNLQDEIIKRSELVF